MKGLLAPSRSSMTHPIRETKIDRVADSVWIRVEAGHVRGSSESLFVIFSFNRTVDQETLTGPRLESGGLDNNVEIGEVCLRWSVTDHGTRMTLCSISTKGAESGSSAMSDQEAATLQTNSNGEAKQVETSLNGNNSMHLENEKQTDLGKRPRDESVEENCDEELGKCFELVS
uniref:Uncharacterized protein n=1 Tax=Ananas comosus var. bracteatus TaxID=296719 RepID=A0A6V7QA24_ANACO|nr:unnamed protein product [Ananas comosus var. bracteatus]